MAGVIGLAASIVQLGGVGAELSRSLYNFVQSSVQADQEAKNLSGDVNQHASYWTVSNIY